MNKTVGQASRLSKDGLDLSSPSVSGRINPPPTGNKETIKAFCFDKIVTSYFSDYLVGESNFKLVNWFNTK